MQIKIESDDPELRSNLQDRCNPVLPYFESSPDVRVLCFAPKSDDEALVEEMGRTNRGVYWPLAEVEAGPKNFPVSVTKLFRDENGNLNYDHLVYLHARTTHNPVGCVLTFAHELQHVRQYVEHYEMLQESKRTQWEWITFLKKQFINFPHEKDAMFASRQIATKICGRGPVSDYINEQLEAASQLSASELAHRESVIWSYQAEWADTFSLQDEVESMRRRIQES